MRTSFFEKSQSKIAEEIAAAAISLDDSTHRRLILASAQACGADFNQVVRSCFERDRAEALRDALDAWEGSASISDVERETLMEAVDVRAAACLSVFAEKGVVFRASEESRPDADWKMSKASALVKACQTESYGSDKKAVADLLNFFNDPAMFPQWREWESQEALDVLLTPSTAPREDGSDSHTRVCLARARLAGALLSSGVPFKEPSATGAVSRESALARAMAVCLISRGHSEEAKAAVEPIVSAIDWKGEQAALASSGGAFALLAPILAPGRSSVRGAYSVRLARELEELVGEKGHAAEGIYERVFTAEELARHPFKMMDPRAELIEKLRREDGVLMSPAEFAWIIERSADGIEHALSAPKANDDSGRAPFSQNLYLLYNLLGHPQMTGVEPCGEREVFFAKAAPALINELVNEYDSMDRGDPGAARAFAEKTRLAAESLLAASGSCPVSEPKKRSLSI